MHPTGASARGTCRVLRERQSGIAGSAASVLTVAQAAHWFDLDAFYREVDRVLKPWASWPCGATAC